MKSLRTFFENPIPTDDEISFDNFKKFSEDHLARLTAAPGPAGGPVEALIAPTAAAHIAYFGNITDVAVAAAVQQSSTKAVNAVIEQFIARVRKEEPGIAYALGGRETPDYQLFYPHGLNEYNQHTMANIGTLMTQFATATTGSSKVPAALAPDIAAMLSSFQSLRALQLGHKGSVATERGERNAARVALAHRTNPEIGLGYFDEGILR